MAKVSLWAIDAVLHRLDKSRLIAPSQHASTALFWLAQIDDAGVVPVFDDLPGLRAR